MNINKLVAITFRLTSLWDKKKKKKFYKNFENPLINE